MGKPILGEHRRLEVVIEENCNFKVRGGMEGLSGVTDQTGPGHSVHFANAFWQTSRMCSQNVCGRYLVIQNCPEPITLQ